MCDQFLIEFKSYLVTKNNLNIFIDSVFIHDGFPKDF